MLRTASLIASAAWALLAPLASGQVTPSQLSPLQLGYDVLLNGQSVATFRAPQLAGQAGAVQITPQPDNWYHVLMTWNPFLPVQQDELSVQFDFTIKPDFHWLPHLTPFPSVVVGPHSMRSPAIVVAEGSTTLTIVPDVDLMVADPSRPWFFDMDARQNRAWVGLTQSVLNTHVFFTKVPGLTFPPGRVQIGFYVKAHTDPGPVPNPFREAAELLWTRFGRPLYDAGQPNRVQLRKYVETAYEFAFLRWEKEVWQEDVTGTYGGPQLVVDYTQSPVYEGPPGAERPFEVWNQAWYHSLRTASGMLRWSQRKLVDDWERRANQVKELSLAAPQIPGGGIFPCSLQLRGQGPDGKFQLAASKWMNSGRSPKAFGIDRTWYHVLDASDTATWMVRWYDELEADPRLLNYAISYADWLLTQQDANGFFPIWLDPLTLTGQTVLTNSPENSKSATFLFELAAVTGDANYLAAAIAAIDAVVNDPLPDGRWEDFEAYWSDNFFGRPMRPGDTGLVGQRVPRNNMYKQNNFSMFWTAEALIRAYEATGQQSYLDWGVRTLDELSMTQAVWQPPYMYVPVLGGFGVMNTDGEWNDARQSLFGEVFLDYYRATGNPEYFERGIASIKAGFSMMYTPLNPVARQQWQTKYPSLRSMDYGFTMENYGHQGATGPDGTGVDFFSIFDWGCGSASEGVGRVLDHYGHVYIDRARNQGFGVDNIDVVHDPATGEWVLTDLVSNYRKIRVEFDSGPGQTLLLQGTARVQ